MDNISNKEKQIFRDLAQQYMEVAALPVQKEKIRLWKALNSGKMQRPMVVIDQLPLTELDRTGELNCIIKNPFWRNLEYSLRYDLYRWRHFPVDMVLDPYITIPMAIHNSGYGISPKVNLLQSDSSYVASQHFENQLQELEDLEKIKDMVITHDDEQSKQRLDQAADILHGIAPVKLSGGIQFHLGVWDTLSQLMGVENIYYDFIDRPEFLHTAMERITQATIAGIEQANKLNVSNDTINVCHCSYIYTDELLPDSGAGKGPVSKNCWSFGLAQLFSSVSPTLFAEFEIPYIFRMAEYFGMLYYGCCDRMDDRLEWVKKIPNVKKISCSPWSNRNNFAANIGPDLIMSNKPSPAFVATDIMDGDAIRRDIRETIDAARQNQVNLEFILKDISTIRNQPERLDMWAKIAMEEVSAY